MLETDRQLYLNFAADMELNFHWAAQLIDGQRQAEATLAGALALKTATSPELWQTGGDQGRLLAIKLWAEKQPRRPAVDVSAAWPPPVSRRCRNCD